MLTRAIPLVLVMVAACSHVPDYSACRLVGRWKPDPARAHPYDHEGFSARGLWFGVEAAPTSEKSMATWTLHEDQSDRLVVTIESSLQSAQMSKPPQVPGERTFVFDSTDAMHEVGGVFDGVKYARMPEPVQPPNPAAK